MSPAVAALSTHHPLTCSRRPRRRAAAERCRHRPRRRGKRHLRARARLRCETSCTKPCAKFQPLLFRSPTHPLPPGVCVGRTPPPATHERAGSNVTTAPSHHTHTAGTHATYRAAASDAPRAKMRAHRPLPFSRRPRRAAARLCHRRRRRHGRRHRHARA
jgi:hypothetical protein